jgi:aspartyl-tRNA(Asn)/glutamyl-tRNA(Gln) amidotransferase subunit A
VTDLLYLSTHQLAEKYRQCAVSPVEVLDAVFARATAIQPSLNPFCLFDTETARAAAEESGLRWAAGAPLSLLDGVPIAVKDNHAVRGQVGASGSKALEPSTPAAADVPMIARLREAGAILYARTTMPDMAWKAVTDSPRTGVTRNPWNRELTPGGSSGGSAVAVATGCGPIATGSDGGGSIRIPAAFTGLYGIKPTTGRIPGLTEAPDISAPGPLTRSVADAALALSVMCRPDASDPMASALVVPDFTAAIAQGVKGMRIAVSPVLGPARTDPARLGPLRAAAKALEDAGAIVEEAVPPGVDIRDSYVAVCEAAFAGAIARLPPDRVALLDPGLFDAARRGMMTSAAVSRGAELDRIRLMRSLIAFLSRYDLLLTPCVPIAPFAADTNKNTPDPVAYPEWYDWTPYTWVFNAAKMPAASCPWGLDLDGLPQAVQLAAAHFREDAILRASAVLEAAMPFQRPPV